jgi:hypothetical protein
MGAEQSMVAVGGIGLIGATFWKSSQRTSLDNLVWHGQSSPAAKKALLQVAGESVLVLILYLVAGQSDTLGLSMVVVVLTLWILFYMEQSKISSAPAPGGSVA